MKKCPIEDCNFEWETYAQLSQHGHTVHRMTLVIINHSKPSFVEDVEPYKPRRA